MSLPYNRPGSAVLKPGMAPVSVSVEGIYFRCVSADGHFQMSFDGSQFFDFERGLGFGPLLQPFKELWFKAADDATANNTITFLYGTVPIQDSRFNVIADSALATIYTQRPPTFFWADTNLQAVGANNIVAGATTVSSPYADPISINGFLYKRVYLEVYNGGAYGAATGGEHPLAVSGKHIDGTYELITLVPAYERRLVDAEGPLKVSNAAAIGLVCSVSALYYATPVGAG